MKIGPAGCPSRRATSSSCSRSCPTFERPPRACHARSISPKPCPVSKWPSPPTPSGGPVFPAAYAEYSHRLQRLFLFGLPAHRLLRRRDRLLIAEEAAAERLQLFVQLVQDRDARRDVEIHDVA